MYRRYDDWVAHVKTIEKGGGQVEPADSAELRQRKTGREGTVSRRHAVCQLAFSRARCSYFFFFFFFFNEHECTNGVSVETRTVERYCVPPT